MAGEDVIIGIDLGTTYSCVGVWDWNFQRVEILPNIDGNRTTPSYVSYTPTERLVGEAAKTKQMTNLENTIFNAKRIIGRPFSQIRPSDLQSWPFTVVSTAGNTPRYRVTHRNQVVEVSPEEVSALVLGRLKETAERYLRHPVRRAVVTVPAYFTEPQKQATKDAAVLAGLEVVKLLTEPTAAALAYGLDHRCMEGDKSAKAQVDGLYILVFDLGGGTFDVSVLKLDGRGSFITKAITGDFHLGGEDFDERLVQQVHGRFQQENPTIALSRKSIRKIRAECERAKRNLSASMETVIDMELQGVEFTYSISRGEFEAATRDLFDNVMKEVDQALTLARISKEEVDDVVLVGGSTRIPCIQNRLEAYFNGKTLWRGMNPDEAVAFGAAIQAAALTANTRRDQDGQGGAPPPGLGKLTLTAVTPITLGIELSDGTLDVLIPRATRLPTGKSEFYTTAVDNQKSVIVKVFEGEDGTARNNSLLGKFSLLLDPAPAGVPKVEVRFEITTEGLFVVTGRDLATNRQQKIEIEKPNLTDAEKEKIMQPTHPAPAGTVAAQITVATPGMMPQQAPQQGGAGLPPGPDGGAMGGVHRGPAAGLAAGDRTPELVLQALYDFVLDVQQRVAASRQLDMSSKASVSMGAGECLAWLSTHPGATVPELDLQRQMLDLKWDPVKHLC